MRALLVVSLLTLVYPAAARAQAPASPPAAAAPNASPSASPNASAEPAKKATGAAAKRGGDITRDEYVAHAKESAEKRFDRMDADHDGVLTADERRAYREGHTRHRASPAPASH